MSPHGITGPPDQTSRNLVNKFRLTTPPTRTSFVVFPQKVCIQNDVRTILRWSKKLCTLACKWDPMARDRDETETYDFQSETRSRPRPPHVSTRPRRLETTSRDRLETETSRPRLHPWMYYWQPFCGEHFTDVFMITG